MKTNSKKDSNKGFEWSGWIQATNQAGLHGFKVYAINGDGQIDEYDLDMYGQRIDKNAPRSTLDNSLDQE